MRRGCLEAWGRGPAQSRQGLPGGSRKIQFRRRGGLGRRARDARADPRRVRFSVGQAGVRGTETDSVTRRVNDFYETASWQVDALVDNLPELSGTVWCPCVGDGSLMRRLLELRPDLKFITNDI